MRRLAPRADGMLLPLASLLAGLGYVFIVRLDEARPSRRPGRPAVGVADRRRRRVRRHARRSSATSACSSAYRYTAGLVGLGLLLLPLVPGIGQTINGSRIWVSHRADQLPARRVRQDRAGHLLRRLPGREERPAAHQQGDRPGAGARPQAPRARARGLGRVAGRDGGGTRPGLVAAVLHAVPGHHLGRHPAGVVPGRRPACCSPAGATFAHAAVQPRAGARRHLAQPVAGGQRRGLPDRAERLRHGRRRASPAPGLGLGIPTAIPEVETDFIFAAIVEELGLLGATAVLIAFLLIIGAGLRIALRTDQRVRGPARRRPHHAASACRRSSSWAASCGCMPLTGVTLPFVSYGGSSLIANFVLIALLLRISDDTRPPGGGQARRPRPDPDGGLSRGQADPQPRAVPAGLLHGAVRAAQPVHGPRRPGTAGQAREQPRDRRATSRPRGAVTTADGVLIADSVAVRRPLRAAAPVPAGRHLRPHHRLLQLQLGSGGRREAPTTTSWRGAPTLRPAGHRRPVRRPRAGRQPHAVGPQRRPADRPRGAGRPGGLGGRRSTPAPAPSSPCGRSRATTPTCSSTHDLDGRHRGRAAAQRRPQQAAAWPAPSTSGSSPARRSRSSPARPASRPAASPRTSRSTRRRRSYDRRAGAPDPQLRRRHLRRHAVRHPPAVVQLRLRPDGRRAGQGRRDDRRAPRPSASTTAVPIDLPGAVASVFPTVGDHRVGEEQPLDRTTACWPRSRSARTACRPRRCRWRWWPPASPTTARS